MGRLRLHKYHGLGNDFLVLVDLEGRHPVEAALARALCDRRRGVGADGLIRATAGSDGAVAVMELWNADGSRAETSGNGLRCLGRALVDLGAVAGPTLTVVTDAGPRCLTVEPDGSVRVEMGPAQVEEVADGAAPRTARVALGNPHLVVLDDGGDLDLGALGAANPGVNVELVRGGGDELTLRTWERGVGETPACGSGSCAAAAAARTWGLVGPRVVVHNPGGDLEVDLSADSIVLTGPAEPICTVEVPCR